MRQISRVLVTGGAGFIGSHVVDLLLSKGYAVRVLDNLDPEVHGRKRRPPSYFNKEAEFVYGDVRKRVGIVKAMKDTDAVIHLAAKVGVSQSMRQIEKYVSTNTFGTANLLDVLVNKDSDVKKLIVASSIAIYGEGKYLCENCGPVYPEPRTAEQLKTVDWEPKCPKCDKSISPAPTDEEKPIQLTSIYGITKYQQEKLCLFTGRAHRLPTVALRYCNVYGPRQALNNPYTGCIAIFIVRLLHNKPPIIFEDGGQLRDFIYVKDVAKATVLALESNAGDYQALNVGTGKPTAIVELAEELSKLSGKNLKPLILNKHRIGDVRSCYADITKMKRLKFQLDYSLDQGLRETWDWVRSQSLPRDLVKPILQDFKAH